MTDNHLNEEVTTFLDSRNHPMHEEIQQLRKIIMSTPYPFSEDIKWNGPNYSIGGQDRITMRIYPEDQIQLIFHRGTKKMEHPDGRLIQEDTALLAWRSNDRAVATFSNKEEIEMNRETLIQLIDKWLEVSMNNE